MPRTALTHTLNASQLQPHLVLYYTACAMPYVCLTLPSSHVKFKNLREFTQQGMTLGRTPATKPLAPPSGSLGQCGREGRALGLQPGAPIKPHFHCSNSPTSRQHPVWWLLYPRSKAQRRPGLAGIELGCSTLPHPLCSFTLGPAFLSP